MEDALENLKGIVTISSKPFTKLQFVDDIDGLERIEEKMNLVKHIQLIRHQMYLMKNNNNGFTINIDKEKLHFVKSFK